MKRVNKQLKEFDKKILNSKNGIKIFYIILALIVPPVWEFGGAFSSMIVGIFGVDEADYTIRFFLSYPLVFSLGFIIYILTKIKDKIFK
jgi:Fe2+ transport system protein B